MIDVGTPKFAMSTSAMRIPIVVELSEGEFELGACEERRYNIEIMIDSGHEKIEDPPEVRSI
jgi:hypothetical protein